MTGFALSLAPDGRTVISREGVTIGYLDDALASQGLVEIWGVSPVNGLPFHAATADLHDRVPGGWAIAPDPEVPDAHH